MSLEDEEPDEKLELLNIEALMRMKEREDMPYIPQTCPNPSCGAPMKLWMPEIHNWICIICRAQTLDEPPVLTDMATYMEIMEKQYELERSIIPTVMLALCHVPPLEAADFGDEDEELEDEFLLHELPMLEGLVN